MKPLTQREREKLRETFRPRRVDLLFIGESPPASGRFFYSRDSGLYRAMREAFQSVDPTIGDENFLGLFQESGCYLIDLAGEPVDRMDPQQRQRARLRGEKRLAEKIAQICPRVIAPLMRAIAGNVARAVSLAQWQGPMLEFPYPGRWSRHRAEFVKTVAPVIRRLICK